MKKLTYQILNYLLLALSIGGLIGMIVITKVAGEVNVYATLCLCLMILGIVCVVLLQCIYRVTKKPLETLDQTKEWIEKIVLSRSAKNICSHTKREAIHPIHFRRRCIKLTENLLLITL